MGRLCRNKKCGYTETTKVQNCNKVISPFLVVWYEERAKSPAMRSQQLQCVLIPKSFSMLCWRDCIRPAPFLFHLFVASLPRLVLPFRETRTSVLLKKAHFWPINRTSWTAPQGEGGRSRMGVLRAQLGFPAKAQLKWTHPESNGQAL